MESLEALRIPKQPYLALKQSLGTLGKTLETPKLLMKPRNPDEPIKHKGP